MIHLFSFFVCYSTLVNLVFPKVLGDISLAWLLFYLVSLVFIFRCLARQEFKLGTAYFAVLFVYCLIVSTSIYWTPYYSYDLFTLKRLFARLVVPVVVAIMAFNILDTPESRRHFTGHLIVAGCLFSMLAIYQQAFGGASLEDDRMRAAATFDNPNGLAVYLVLIIPTLLYCLKDKLFANKFLIPCLAILILGILCTGSRKGVITAGLSFFLFFWIFKKYNYLLVSSILFLLVCTLFIATTNLSSRFTSDRMEYELSARFTVVPLGLRMFADHPLFGLGYDGFSDNLQRYVPRAEKGRKPHNEYIDHLVSYGLVGIVPFLAIFFYPLAFFFKRLFFFAPSPEFTAQKNMAGVGVSSIVPFMINNWFAGGLFSYWPVMMVYFSIVTMVLRTCTEHDPPSLPYGLVQTWPQINV